jgi:hypothetical protein
MGEWELRLGLLWVIAALFAAARLLAADEPTDRSTADTPAGGPVPVATPDPGAPRPGWPPGLRPPAPPGAPCRSGPFPITP